MRHLLRSSVLAIAASVVAFLVMAGLVAQLPGTLRLDLTEEGLFTLSDATEDVLTALDDTVTLTYYFSESVATPYPSLLSYGKRVGDLLREYDAVGGDRVTLERVDPEPFSPAEDEALALGLQGVPTGAGETIYMGLVARTDDGDQEIITFFNQERERFLEYDLTKLIADLGSSERPTIAILTSLPIQGGLAAFRTGRREPWVLYEMLSDSYELQLLDPDFDQLGEGVDMLMAIHPPELNDFQQYLIDQFVLSGRPAAIFVDPLSEASAVGPGMPPMPGQGSNMGRLFGQWGVELIPDKVVADFELAQRVNFGGVGPRAIKDYVLWLAVGESHINRNSVISGELELVNLATAGALRAIDDAAANFEPLITSSAVSALVDVAVAQGEPDPDQLLRDVEPDAERYVLAGLVTGQAETAFPDGAPERPVPPEEAEDADAAAAEDLDAAEEGLSGDGTAEDAAADQDVPTEAVEDADRDDSGSENSAEDSGQSANATGNSEEPAALPVHRDRAESPIRVLVVSDSDLFDDRFWVQVQQFLGQRILQPIADNSSFVLNAADALAGDSALIALRSRGVSQRPFLKIEDMRRAAESRYLQEEERLQQELRATEERLAELEAQRQEDDALLSPEQEAELERFRAQVLDIRQELRAVQRGLRSDIESLVGWLSFVNIALIPILLTVGVLVLTAIRRRRKATR